MNNDKLKIFNIAGELDNLDFNKSGIGEFGFIIPKKYNDAVIYFPPNKDNNTKIHHASVMKFMIGKLFLDEKKEHFSNYINFLKEYPECSMIDSDEIAYGCFMASLNSCVFLNTSNKYDYSGILFIPSNNEKLSSTKIFRIDETVDFLKRNDKYQISEVVLVPSLEDTINNKNIIKIQPLSDYHMNKGKSL